MTVTSRRAATRARARRKRSQVKTELGGASAWDQGQQIVWKIHGGQEENVGKEISGGGQGRGEQTLRNA
jgi:hypothetical protein